MKNFKDIHNLEADLWVSGRNPLGKKLPGKLLSRKKTLENCPLEKSLINIKQQITN